jgi:acetylornithine deacetylase/succinyl-diaminopimelate desuccinylase-like protein
MNFERLVDRALRIQRIPAPTFSEMARAELMLSEFVEAGLADISRDATGNVYARVPGGSCPPVVVSAHLDTVFPAADAPPARRVGDCLRGPGIGDNAISLAALVELGFDYQEDPPEGDVWLVADVSEEGLGNLAGMRQVVSRFGDGVGAYIVLEGMALGQVYHRALPIWRYRVSARTAGGHSWIHAGRPSAVHALLGLGAELLRLPLPATPRTTLNVGRIEGGTTINTIAAEAWLEIDLRSAEGDVLDDLRQQLERLVAARRRPDVEVSLESIGDRPGGFLPADHWLTLAACRALEDAGEGPPVLETASTDASLPLSLGLPAVCVGLTRGGEAHTSDEYIELDPLPRGYQSVRSLISAAARHSPLNARRP